MLQFMTMQKIRLPVMDRWRFCADLKSQGFSDALVQWMASNLVPANEAEGINSTAAKSRHGKPLVWSFDVFGAAELYASYRNVDAWDLLAAPPPQIRLNILRAARSDRWTDSMIKTLHHCEALASTRHAHVRHYVLVRVHVVV